MIVEKNRRQKKDGTFRVWFSCVDCGMYGAATTDDADDLIASVDEMHAVSCRPWGVTA